MGRLKDGLKSLGTKLKATSKNSQGRAFARIVQFFAIMIALTIFVKGASAVTMPKVTVKDFASAEITDSIDATGTVVALNSKDIEIVAGLTVKRILAPIGTNVTAETKLIEFDTAALEQAMLTQKSNLVQLKVDLLGLQNAPGLDASAVEGAQKMLDNANATLNSTRSAGDAAVAEAQNVVPNAQAVVDAAAADRDAKEKAYREVIATGEEPDVVEEYKKIWDAAKEVVTQANSALLAAQQSAPPAIAAAERRRDDDNRAAQSSVNEAAKSLEKAQKDYALAEKEYALTCEKNKIAIQLKQTEIEKQTKAIEDLNKVLDSAGIMLSGMEGTVTAVTVNEGDVTVAGAYVRVSTGSEGYLIECMVANNSSKQIKVGSAMYVSTDDYGGRLEAKVVSKTAPDANGLVKVKASLPQNYGWSEGDSKKVMVVLSSRTYGNTVPLTAIHSDKDGTFIYVLVDEKTILGTQTVARRASVTVQEPQGKEVASVDFKEGYYYDAKVVVGSSKPLNDGDWVRVEA